MDLHHQPVVEAHLRHLGQHLGAEGAVRIGVALAGANAVEERLRFAVRQIGCLGSRMAVIGRGCAERLEIVAACAVGCEIARP